MSKLKKIAALIKLCIRKPSTILKGIKYFWKYGYVGMRQNMGSRAVYELKGDTDQAQSLTGDIRFSIIMPVYNVDLKWLELAIRSVEHQSYDNWELCIVDDASTDPKVCSYLRTITNEKIKIKFLNHNCGISGASNEAVHMSTGMYLALLDNDDELTTDALLELYSSLKQQEADVLYSDMDIIDQNNNHGAPLYKPDWSPDLFTSQMYVGHLLCIKKDIFDLVGGFRSEFDGSQDYDLLLRVVEKTNKIMHISKVLYSWRALPTSTAVNAEAKPYAQIAGKNAIQQYLDRILGQGKAEVCETKDLFVYDVRYHLEKMPLASIIIPTKDHADDLKAAIDSIREKTLYSNYEIIILNNNSEKEETFQYFETLKIYPEIRVVDAAYPFNWSKLNNQGIELAKGSVIVCLNNDVVVKEKEWLTRLVEKAMQKHVGTVGGLLLYPDGTIQHAGIVVGMGGWADHVFKGMQPIHCGTPFISPMVTRNVSASTGACLAFRKELIENIGGFDERFVICGSDVELSLRASKSGYYNVYDPRVCLYHYESKSRGSYIPKIDFTLSALAYRKYRELGDPYYNKNLDYNVCVPTVVANPQFEEVQKQEVAVAEIQPMKFKVVDYPRKRINLVVPSINSEHIFGGISTALKFFGNLTERLGFDMRIVLSDAKPSEEAVEKYSKKFVFVESDQDSVEEKQIVCFADRKNKSLSVSKNDYFVFTGWWTAYCIQEAYRNCALKGELCPNPFVYFIQDYEPGFYPWSTRYLLADSTYRSEFKQIAIFNSQELHEFFVKNGYHFEKELEFAPLLNKTLREKVNSFGKIISKKKQILIYGRPSTERNAFELVIYGLKKWVEISEIADEWEIVSAGETHRPVDLGCGKIVYSLGKLTLEEYALVLEESYAGISLMVSPHPSYPPLEMAVFDVNVITNTYGNKDLKNFNPHVTSLTDVNPINIARSLEQICMGYRPAVEHLPMNEEYCAGQDVFPFIDELVTYLQNATGINS